MKNNKLFNKLSILGITGALLISSTALARGGHGRHNPDTDGDGVVSQAEFLSRAETKFNARDTDGDGVISREEILGRAENRFAEIDADGDGVLTRDEMRSHHRSRRSGPPQQ